QLDWSEWVAGMDQRKIVKVAILKPYVGPHEKGVVFVSFENQWVKLLQGDLKDFSEHYDLIVAPSSSPHNLVNYVFANRYPCRFFSLISNAGDPVVLSRISSNLVVLPLYASQWVNPGRFRPRPRSERDIDLLMVASFGKVKRHHLLF